MSETWGNEIVRNKENGEKKTGKKLTSSEWYGQTFDVQTTYAQGQIPGTETIAKVVRVKRKDGDQTEHLSFEKWGVDGRFLKAFQYPTVRFVPGLMVDALKAMGAIPTDTPFLLGEQKAGKRK